MYRYLLAIALAVFPFCSVSSTDITDSRDEILAVVEQFKDSIVEKDKKAFLSLFLHESVTWQTVMSEERYEFARLSDPTVTRSAYEAGENPEKFIDGIVTSSSRLEETFENVLVDTDGAGASVAFNFTFLRNGEVLNVGREYWLMVKTDVGWKIASVIWSRNTPPASN